MKVLLIDPLVSLSTEPSGLPESKTNPRLIIIDGLNGCKDQDVQCDILQVIAKAILNLPYPSRFFVTSRPGAHLVRTFDNNAAIKRVSVTRHDLSNDPDAKRDIRTFLNQEFKELHSGHPAAKYLRDWPKEEDVTSLVDRSSGHFVYPATVIRYIGSPKHHALFTSTRLPLLPVFFYAQHTQLLHADRSPCSQPWTAFRHIRISTIFLY